MAKKSDDYLSVQKAIEILMAFTPHGREMGTIEISRKLELNKSTVSRILGVLANHELLQQNPDSKKYMLGEGAAAIGRAVGRSLAGRMVDIAQPHMNRLRDVVGESVSLEVLNGGNVVVAAEAPGTTAIRVAFNPGDKTPFHVASGAKAILAFSSQEMIDYHISGKLTRYTVNTITDPAKIKKQYKEIAKEGVAFDREEFKLGVFSIGAPIFNNVQKPVAAVSVCSVSSRLTADRKTEFVSQVKVAASEISKRIFYKEQENKKG